MKKINARFLTAISVVSLSLSLATPFAIQNALAAGGSGGDNVCPSGLTPCTNYVFKNTLSSDWFPDGAGFDHVIMTVDTGGTGATQYCYHPSVNDNSIQTFFTPDGGESKGGTCPGTKTQTVWVYFPHATQDNIKKCFINGFMFQQVPGAPTGSYGIGVDVSNVPVSLGSSATITLSSGSPVTYAGTCIFPTVLKISVTSPGG